MGISTIIGAYISWMMLFHRDKNILVMATKYQTASNLVKKVKAIINTAKVTLYNQDCMFEKEVAIY